MIFIKYWLGIIPRSVTWFATNLPPCLVWSPRWLGFPFISHAANHLPKSLITKAKRELCIKKSKDEMQLQKKQD